MRRSIADLDLAGRRFGRLTAIDPTAPFGRQAAWLCRCDCGTEKPVRIVHLLKGSTVSCGCSRRKHGQHNTPEYIAWMAMKTRCKSRGEWARNYRDVEVWPGWLTDFEAFFKHVGERPAPGYSLDRIDPFGNYEPGNVRWATAKVQANNRRPILGLTVSRLEPRRLASVRAAGERYRQRQRAAREAAALQLTLFDRRVLKVAL